MPLFPLPVPQGRRAILLSFEGVPLPVYRPRTRLVNFRLSEDEYLTLKDTCARSGARSVSDYARAAVLSGTPPVPALSSSSPCSDRWERLETVVNQLESRVIQLIEKEPVTSNG